MNKIVHFSFFTSLSTASVNGQRQRQEITPSQRNELGAQPLLRQILRILVLLTLTIVGCKKHEDPSKQTGKCRLTSYSTNGIPVYLVYDNKKALVSGNYFSPSNIEVRYNHDDQRRLLKVVSAGKHILEDTLLADFTYDANRLRTLRYYGRKYDLNTGKSDKTILTCTLYYGKSNLPDSMQVTESKIDSIGREYISEPIRIDKFLFDEDENLTKQDVYIIAIDGTSSLVASNRHTYDSKPNHLKAMKQIHFLIDQSVPYLFSKNNLLATRHEVPGKLPSDILYKIVYDGDLVVDDGMGFSDMNWLCE